MSDTFPHTEPLTSGEYELTADEVVDLLADQITERRRGRIDDVVASRIFSLVPVLDGLYDRGNVSAVMRTAEGLGIGELHIIEKWEDFKAANRVTQGADKWLDLRKWDEPTGCISDLRGRGFQIVATSLESAKPIGEIDFSVPTAVVFGNERDGVCPEILEASDHNVILPMNGFAQSFNISVAAALTLYHALLSGAGPDLTPAQQQLLRAVYYLRSVDKHAPIIQRKLS